MAIVTDTVLKTYFNTGDQPTEANFVDLIDSKARADDLTAANGYETAIPFTALKTDLGLLPIYEAVTFTIDTANVVKGAESTMMVVASGHGSEPDVSAFKKYKNSQYDNREGIENLYTFYYGGPDKGYWCAITQEDSATSIINDIRFDTATSVNINETSDASGYIYTASAGSSWTPYRLADWELPADVNGYIQCELNGTADEVILGLNDTNTTPGGSLYLDIEYGVGVSSTNVTYTEAGTPTVATGPISATAGRLLRLMRLEGTFYAMHSGDSGATWTIYRTFAATSTGRFYAQINLKASGDVLKYVKGVTMQTI